MKKLIILLAAAAVAVACSPSTESFEPEPPVPPETPETPETPEEPETPETPELAISFERTDNIAVWPGRSIDVAYTLTGVNSGTQFECSADNGWRVEIHATSASSGYLHVTAPSQVVDGDVTMRASNDESDFTQQTLHFVGGFFEKLEQDFYYLDATEQELEIAVTTNIPYEAVIPDDAAWVEWTTDPTAVETGTARFSIARNSDWKLRQTKIAFTVDGEVVQMFTLIQRAAPADEAEIIRFADKTLEALLVKDYDLNGDGSLSYREAAAITELKERFFANSSIASFDELQHFTGLTELPEGLFEKCSELKSIILPESVITIRSYAFYGCSSLTNIVLPVGLRTIEWDAFELCTSLTSIILPDGLEKIGGFCFMGSGLTSIKLPENITVLDGWDTFGGCRNLTSVELPEELVEIGTGTFRGCSNLTSIDLPEKLVKIGISAFLGCSFSKITFPSSVRFMGSNILTQTEPSSVLSITFLSPTPSVIFSSGGQWNPTSDDWLTNNPAAKIYVPASSVEAYKTARGFSFYADRIFPIEE
ncbi:MAG: leucine-rich repeat domain-containing protein [Alistipes sp.]|nr:leucine-rich repeat domain-containing protein [Alistipes senegalensis]MCM1249942.1 leucine-rich repeat domain-containing protein [Alistipes sp.]